MPEYDYACPTCGPFSAFRPMAEFAAPQECAECGKPAPRVLLSVPAIGGFDAGRRAAIAAGERNDSVSGRFSATSGSSHGSGCACCSGKSWKLPRADWARKLS